MKSFLFLSFILLFTVSVNAQVGIGNTNPQGALDITSTTDGLLIPRVALTMTTTVLPVITGTESELVYNTATAGDVTPGYYYLSTATGPWVRLATAAAASEWKLTGNAGTTAGSNFIGTTDVQDFVVKTSAVVNTPLERMRITTAGNVGINTPTPTATALLTINPNTNAIRNGIDMTLTNATSTATGLNIATGVATVNGITVTHNSGALSSTLYGIGAVLSSTNIVSGYNGYRTGSGKSFGIYGITGTLGAPVYNNVDTWAGYFQGRTAITSANPPTSALGTDLEIQNTTAGAAAPATVSLRQTTSQVTNGNVLANLNFGDNYTTLPQAQIQVQRDATASSAADMPTAMTFSTTSDASATLTERVRIESDGDVGIGTSPTVPNASAKLEIRATDRGLLIPNVALAATNNGVTPINAPATSLLVYNTFTSAVGPNQVTPGYYYWNGVWIALATSASTTDWTILGNTNIVDGTNFLGTGAATPVDVAFRRNNAAAGKIGATSTSLGVGALSAGATTNSTAFGNNALTLNTAADNVAVGTSALAANVTGTFNTAVGKSALAANTANANTAVGFTALTASTGGDNTAVGYQALKANTTGIQNTAVGVNALERKTTGSANTAVGHSALDAVGTFSNATAVGFQALLNNTANNNTGIGFQTLSSNTIGNSNTAVGFQANSSNISGSENTAIGHSALGRNTGSHNTAIGHETVFGAISGASDVTAVGWHALFNNSANESTAVGSYALQGSGSALGNTAVGYRSLNNNASGAFNTAVGNQAGFGVTASNNTFVGYFSGQFSTGSFNTALGSNTLKANAASANNVAIGYNALAVNGSTTNTAVGSGALSTNNSFGNVALGYNAGAAEAGSNTLYITNSATTPATSLIWGDFNGTRILRTNSNFQIGVPGGAGSGYVFPLVRGGINQILQLSDGVGTLQWVNPSSLAITETDPQVSSTATSSVPRWNGTTLIDGVITDDGTNVGIGGAPTVGNKLDVIGNTRTTNFQMITGASPNYILQGDAAGNGTWVDSNVKPFVNTGATSGIYSVALTEYTVRAFNGVSEVRLPNAVTNTGKIFVIIGSNTIATKIFSTSGGFIYDDVSNANISVLNPNERYTVQSDGTDWIVIGR